MRTIRSRLILIIILASLFLAGQRSYADRTYTVHRGDTLLSIARKTRVTTKDLRSRNRLRCNYLRIGQRLIVPSTGSSGMAPTRTTGDTALLARLIFAEAGAEPYVGQVAVGGVVLNRVQNPRFPKSIPGVIYQPKAFESVSNGIINREPSGAAQKAADAL